MKAYLNTQNARSQEQLALMQKINEEGVCPFCRENIGRFHPREITLETEHWFASPNMEPYEHARYHFIIISRRCIEKRSDLSSDEWLNLKLVLDTLENLYTMPGNTTLLRSGDWNFTGSSVSHLHCHLIMGSGDPNKKSKARVG